MNMFHAGQRGGPRVLPTKMIEIRVGEEGSSYQVSFLTSEMSVLVCLFLISSPTGSPTSPPPPPCHERKELSHFPSSLLMRWKTQLIGHGRGPFFSCGCWCLIVWWGLIHFFLFLTRVVSPRGTERVNGVRIYRFTPCLRILIASSLFSQILIQNRLEMFFFSFPVHMIYEAEKKVKNQR